MAIDLIQRIMIKPIALLTAMLAFSRLTAFSQENKPLQILPKKISVALPANTLPAPFQMAPSDSLLVNICMTKPATSFPETVYFNPGEEISKNNSLRKDAPIIEALRYYLDTSALNIPLTNNLLNSPNLPLNLIGQSIERFFAPFYFRKYEVTNQEYREFTIWVRDSIARSLLAQVYPSRYYNAHSETLNWGTPIDWNNKDEKTAEALSELFYAENDRLYAKKEMDTHRFVYTYTDANHMVKHIPVYPDTLVWFRDFPYSFNEFQFSHFHHKAYHNYPVTGVSYDQAKAFCHWKTKQIQKAMSSNVIVEVDLPYDYEREYVVTRYATNQIVDIGCVTDLMAMRKQEFFPDQLSEMMKCNKSIGLEDFRTHPADLSRISARKRVTLSTDIDQNNISGINSNVSEWMNESYQENWRPFITKRRKLLESVNLSQLLLFLEDTSVTHNTLDSLYITQLYQQYSKEIPLILKIEDIYNSYCDTDGRLVRGGNWRDNRCLFNNYPHDKKKLAFRKDAMTFVSPSKSSSMIGFRYVIRVKNTQYPH